VFRGGGEEHVDDGVSAVRERCGGGVERDEAEEVQAWEARGVGPGCGYFDDEVEATRDGVRGRGVVAGGAEVFAQLGERAELTGVEGDVFVAVGEEGFVELFDFLLGLGDACCGDGDVILLGEDLGEGGEIGG
jgi:hypothetical protein